MPFSRVSLPSPAPFPPARTSSRQFARRSTLSRVAAVALIVLTVALWARPQLALADGPVLAQPAPSTESRRAEALTQALATASTQLATTSPADRRRVEQTLLTSATTRRRLLLSLMESDPGTVLRLALPASVQSALPPQVSAQLEEETQLEGALEIFHDDSPSGARYQYSLHAGGTRYSLHFAGDEPTHLATGATIRVQGIRLDSMLALAGGRNSVQTVSVAPALSTFGEQRTLVMLVNFSDDTSQPFTAAQVQSAIFGPISSYFYETSYQQTWLTGTVVGWFPLATTSAACSAGTIDTQGQAAAAAAGVNLSAYTRYVYVFPHSTACGFAGAAFIGGTPSKAWMNGTIGTANVAHELGHGLGLFHSHSLDCGAVPLGSSCTASEYGDIFDTMGGFSGETVPSGHFTASQKERLGWLSSAGSPPITTVLTDGTYTLDTYEIAGSGPKALKILKSIDPSTGKRTWYYVESRQPIGFDAWLQSYPNPKAGVFVHTGSESGGNSSYLLDMTPGSATFDFIDPALVVGQSFTDPDLGMTITPESVTTTGAAVIVRLGTPVPVSPAVTVATDQPSYPRNQAVSIKTTVISGGSPVVGASVTLTVTKSSGAIVMANATTGSNGTAVYKLRLRKQDPVGTYHVGAVAKKDTSSGSAATEFTVR